MMAIKRIYRAMATQLNVRQARKNYSYSAKLT